MRPDAQGIRGIQNPGIKGQSRKNNGIRGGTKRMKVIGKIIRGNLVGRTTRNLRTTNQDEARRKTLEPEGQRTRRLKERIRVARAKKGPNQLKHLGQPGQAREAPALL